MMKYEDVDVYEMDSGTGWEATTRGSLVKVISMIFTFPMTEVEKLERGEIIERVYEDGVGPVFRARKRELRVATHVPDDM